MSAPRLTRDQYAYAVAARDELQLMLDRADDMRQSVEALRMLAADFGGSALVPALVEGANASLDCVVKLILARDDAAAFVAAAVVVMPDAAGEPLRAAA